MAVPPFILASSSPRRRELLEQLDLAPTIVAPQVGEAELPGETPRAFALRVAREKGLAVAASHPDSVVLAADTCVVLGERIFNKPRDEEEAIATLQRLSGNTHEVLTGVCAVGPGGQHETVVATRVRFRPISEAEARWYVATGEPMDKAGAYAIQGRGGMFVEAIEGSHSNVIGLPLVEAIELLGRAGLIFPWSATERSGAEGA